MRDRLIAILNAPCDYETMLDLLEDEIKLCEEEKLMKVCNEFLTFSANRNDLIVNELGILGFYEDCKATSQKDIWQAFKNYLKIKNIQ